MKRYSSVLLCAACALLVLSACKMVNRTTGDRVLVGTAQVDITPPVGHRMAGYFDERISTGVHDPLLAKAVVFKQGSARIAMVFCDLVGVPLDVSSRARQEASRATGIPVKHITISATHSHTGPLFGDVRRDYFHERELSDKGVDPREKIFYPDFLTTRLVTVIVEANADVRQASLFAGRGSLSGYSFNRRYHMTNGVVQTNPGILNPGIVRPAGPVDHSVDLLQAKDQDGRPFATITTFACHCDTCSGTQFSGDYPFFMAETLRSTFGDEHLSAFAPGACGDINHIDVTQTNRPKGFEASRQIGTNLAAVILSTRLLTVAKPSLGTRSRTLILPLQEISDEQVAAAKAKMPDADKPGTPFLERVEIVKTLDLAKRGKQYPMEVQVFRIDSNTAVVCLPGEIFVDLGLEIKRRSPFPRTFVMTICNDRPAYVPTLKAFREGSYEVVNSRIKPGGGERLVETALELLAELSE